MTETVLGRISSISPRAIRASWLAPVARTISSERLVAEQAVVDLAVVRGDDDRLVAADEAGAGEDDRLEQVALGADLADPGQVGADVAAEVADGVAGEAGGLLAVEDGLAAADVAARRASAASSSSWAFCLAASTLSLAYRASACFWTGGPYFARCGLMRVDPQAREGRRLAEGLDQLQAERLVGRLLEGGQQAVDLERPGGPERVGQGDELGRVELGPRQHVGGGRPRRRRAARGRAGRAGTRRAPARRRSRPPGTAASASSRTSAGASSRRGDARAGAARARRPCSRCSGSARAVATAWRISSAIVAAQDARPAPSTQAPGRPSGPTGPWPAGCRA